MLRLKNVHINGLVLGTVLGFFIVGSVKGLCNLASAQSPKREESPQPGTPTALELLRRLSDSIRRVSSAQVVSVRVTSPAGRERVSRVEVLTDPGDESAGRPRRVALKLGRVLHIEAVGGQFRAVSPRNDEAAYSVELSGALDAGVLESRLPPLPIPHVAWALGPEWVGTGEHDGEFLLPPLGWVRVESVEQDPARREVTIVGRTPLGPARVTLDERSFALRSVRGTMPESDLAMELTCRDADPEAATWAVNIEGRRKVATLTELRPLPAELQPGSMVGSLGLMNADLAPFAAIDAMKAQAAEPTEAGDGAMLGVMVLYRDAVSGAEDAAYLAAGSMRSLKKNLDRRRLTGEVRTPRVFVQPVAVLDLAAFSPSHVREIASRWDAAKERVVWTSAGQALLDRFERGETAMAVVVDSEMTLLGVASIEVGVNAGDATLAEVRAIIEEKTAPK